MRWCGVMVSSFLPFLGVECVVRVSAYICNHYEWYLDKKSFYLGHYFPLRPLSLWLGGVVLLLEVGRRPYVGER